MAPAQKKPTTKAKASGKVDPKAGRKTKGERPTTAAQYLAGLPPDRRAAVERLRALLNKNLPKGFEETMGYGMLAWVVPHQLFPAGYHCDPSKPLPFINLASQKQHLSLYHMGLYEGPLLQWLKREWPKHTTARLDLGRCCLRLRKLDEIPWTLLAELARRMTPAQWMATYQGVRDRAAA